MGRKTDTPAPDLKPETPDEVEVLDDAELDDAELVELTPEDIADTLDGMTIVVWSGPDPLSVPVLGEVLTLHPDAQHAITDDQYQALRAIRGTALLWACGALSVVG